MRMMLGVGGRKIGQIQLRQGRGILREQLDTDCADAIFFQFTSITQRQIVTPQTRRRLLSSPLLACGRCRHFEYPVCRLMVSMATAELFNVMKLNLCFIIVCVPHTHRSGTGLTACVNLLQTCTGNGPVPPRVFRESVQECFY